LLVRGPSAWGFEGVVDMRPYKAQWLAWQCPVATCFHSVEHGGVVAGMALRQRGRSHKADGDGGDRFRWPDVTATSRAGAELSCVIPSRVSPSFFEGAVCWPYGSGWYSAAGWLLATPHSVAQWQG
jgi:hypothetical protein